MSPKTPEIGIALAAYEPNIEYFREQLFSIINQTEKNWICVISFDSEVIDPGVADSRFYFIKNDHRLGHAKNFEAAAQKCLQIAPGIRFLAFCDQDDVWYPRKLERLKSMMNHLPPLSGVHSNMNLLFPDGTRVSGWEFEGRQVDDVDLTSITIKNVCTGAASLFDAELFRLYPHIPAAIRDHDHWYAMLSVAFGRLVGIRDALYDYRQHSHNVIGAQEKSRLFRLRKNWTPAALVHHFGKMTLDFEERVALLPIQTPEKRDLASKFVFIKTFFKALLKRNTMLARAALAMGLGSIARRFI